MVETARSADGTKIAYERTGDGPVLILVGGASPDWAAASVGAVIGAIPGATQKVLKGQTHTADPAVLAPVLIDYFG